MNLPNSLTIARMVLVPLLVVVLLTEFEGSRIAGVPKEFVAAAIFGIASLTDWLDGYLARRRRQVTWLGQILDPIADKLLTTAAFVSLVQLDMVPAWIVAVIIGREFAVTWLRSEALGRGIVMSASGAGKAKTVSQIVAIYVMLLALRVPAFEILRPPALFVALGLTLYSGFDYFRRFSKGATPRP